MKKLCILRVLIIAVFNSFLFAMANMPVWMKQFEFVRKGFKLVWPIYWLRHYLRGTGKALRVPEFIVKEAEKVFLAAIKESNDSYCRGPVLGGYSSLKYRPYCVYHSTLYEGAGFHGRPTLFYLLGGFTFRLYPGVSWGREDGILAESLVVSGNDHYDWHADASGRFFSSPIGTGIIAKTVIKIAGVIFGKKYFLEEGSPFSVTGEMGISNELWHDFKYVGASEFNSYFSNVEICENGLTYDELDELFDPDWIRDQEHEEEYDEYEEEYDDEEEYKYED